MKESLRTPEWCWVKGIITSNSCREQDTHSKLLICSCLSSHSLAISQPRKECPVSLFILIISYSILSTNTTSFVLLFIYFFLTRRKNKSAETDVLLNKSQIHFWESPRKREDEAAENWELTLRHLLCARWLGTEKAWGGCGDVLVGKTLHKHKDENSNPWQPCQCQMGMLAHL